MECRHLFFHARRPQLWTLVRFLGIKTKRVKKNWKQTQDPGYQSEENQASIVAAKAIVRNLTHSPVSYLSQVLNRHRISMKDCISSSTHHHGGKVFHKVKLCFDIKSERPVSFQKYVVSMQKQEASKLLAAHAVAALKKAGYFNERMKYVHNSKVALEEFWERLSKPTRLELQEHHVAEMESIVTSFQHLKSTIVKCEKIEDSVEGTTKMDLTTGRPLSIISPSHKIARTQALFNHQLAISGSTSQSNLELSRQRRQLPIFSYRKQIIETIANNRVVVLCGSTGCGKSTQVPQYIFEEAIDRFEGANCNILMTQPRRISAIAIARRIAQERVERFQESVGYAIRLEMKQPINSGSILCCTPGLALQISLKNLSFEGVSHVIIDEVHERDLLTDFLLISVKRALEVNPELKVVVMSATLQTQLFSNFFDGCPVIEIPGKTFHVEEHFLEDFARDVGYPSKKIAVFNPVPPRLDLPFVADTIKWIHQTKPDGAILCFLPTFADIRGVKKILENEKQISRQLFVCYAHSRIPIREMDKIYEKPVGLRKVVLATNIAETSLTVEDVVYVVNTGTRRDTVHDPEKDVSISDIHWAPRSAQKQRRGRAGRVADGYCYHLFTRNFYEQFEEQEAPRLLKEPLEGTILMSKLHDRSGLTAEEFFRQAVDQPNSDQVSAAVSNLKTLKLLDDEECLTDLGRKIANLPCEPVLGRALALAIFFKCLEPVLGFVAIREMGGKELLEFPDELTASGKTNLESDLVDETSSDHMLQIRLLDCCSGRLQFSGPLENGAKPNLFASRFCQRLKQSLFGACRSNGLLSTYGGSYVNRNDKEQSLSLIKAVFAGAYGTHFLRLLPQVVHGGKIVDKPTFYSPKSELFEVSSRSLWQRSKLKQSTGRWFVFSEKSKRSASLRDKYLTAELVSEVNPLVPFICSGMDITKEYEKDTGFVVLKVAGSKFFSVQCEERLANSIMEMKTVFGEALELHFSHVDIDSDSRRALENIRHEMTNCLERILK